MICVYSFLQGNFKKKQSGVPENIQNLSNRCFTTLRINFLQEFLYKSTCEDKLQRLKLHNYEKVSLFFSFLDESVTFRVNWEKHFVNFLHEERNFLGEIEKYPVQFAEIENKGILSSSK